MQLSIATLLKCQLVASLLCWCYPFRIEKVWYQDYRPANGPLVQLSTHEVFGLLDIEIKKRPGSQYTLVLCSEDGRNYFWVNHPSDQPFFCFVEKDKGYFARKWFPRIPWLMAGSLALGILAGRITRGVP